MNSDFTELKVGTAQALVELVQTFGTTRGLPPGVALSESGLERQAALTKEVLDAYEAVPKWYA